MMKGLTMVDNVDIAYCMAQLENRIRREWISAKNYLDYCDGNATTSHFVSDYSEFANAVLDEF